MKPLLTNDPRTLREIAEAHDPRFDAFVAAIISRSHWQGMEDRDAWFQEWTGSDWGRQFVVTYNDTVLVPIAVERVGSKRVHWRGARRGTGNPAAL